MSTNQSKSPPMVVTVSSFELVALLEHTANKKWTELTLFGPNVSSLAVERSRFKELKHAKRIYHCLDFCPEILRTTIPSLKNLTSLNVWGNNIGDEGARVIASLNNLTLLVVGGNCLSDEGAKAIASMNNLIRLNVGNNSIGEEGARAIASMNNLIRLNVEFNSIGDEGARAIAALNNLTELNVNRNNIGEEGARAIATLDNLTELTVGSNSIGEEGARAIASMNNLIRLNVEFNSIGDEGARAIAALNNLTELNVNRNNIGDEGARAIAALNNLTSLTVSNNSIGEEGARAIAALNNLTELNVNRNNIGDEGARAIAALNNLTSLTVNNNSIGEEGARAIATLNNLTSLTVSNNSIGEEGARAIAALNNLTSLNVSNNSIGEEGARAIAALNNLTSLNVEFNSIGEEGARAIAALNNLTSLNVEFNSIGEEGARAIAALNNLTSLNVSNNSIGEEGARAIAALNNLTSLNVSNNSIGEEGARAIAALNNLTSLNVEFNSIGEEGARAIAALNNLTSLNVEFNSIGEEGARAIAALNNLTSLNVDYNSIGEEGARAIAALNNLTSLTVSNNSIGEEGARAIAALNNLTSLTVSNNSIGDEGARAIATLDNLTELDLNKNLFTDPAPLVSLTRLQRLNLSNTLVADLSTLIPLLSRGLPVAWESYGAGLLVGDCPLTQPPPEVVKQGRDAVLNYFHELEAQGVDYLYEAKVLLVGEGRAGKTSLVRRLYQPELSLPPEEDTTKGIEIHRHTIPQSDGSPLQLNVWDFGGQQIYRATHQFFLTKRSLYILLDDTAKDHQTVHDQEFKYWLEVIETLSNSSPVLIYQNEKGGRQKQIDEAGIKGRFPNVKDVYGGDLKHADAADELREAITMQVKRLPHMGDAVPAEWIVIREALEARSREIPHITESEYFTLYAEHLDSDVAKARHLSQYFHDLGVCLHFQDHSLLKQTVVLENEWATEAVFRVLEDNVTKTNRGRFTQVDCDRIWADSIYGSMHAQLLALMERFELCYRLPDVEPAAWLAPQLLSPSQPITLVDWGATGDLVLNYRYDFLPKGLMSRLMVRMHRYVKDTAKAWMHGALFERGSTVVLAHATANGNDVVIRARGSERKALLSVIAADLDALNEGFGLGEKVEKNVPCVCSQCVDAKEPELFSERHLMRRRAANKLTIECPASFDEMSVITLLDGLAFDIPAWAENARKEISASEDTSEVRAGVADTIASSMQRTIKLFLASSEELKDHRDAFDLYLRQQNDRLRNEGYYLEVIRWENFLDAMSKTRLQDEYNDAIRDCEIFVSLFRTKTGKYTEEEFDVAHRTFEETGAPLIFTFFEEPKGSYAKKHREALNSLWNFQERLSDLGHFYTEYESIEHLKLKFREQLDRLMSEGKLGTVSSVT